MAQDIASHGGVVIMLAMLREHAQEEETVAATVHILYLITHGDVMRGGLEEQVIMWFRIMRLSLRQWDRVLTRHGICGTGGECSM